MMAMTGAVGLVAPNLLGKPAFGQTPSRQPLWPHRRRRDAGTHGVQPADGRISRWTTASHFSVFDALFRIDPEGVIVPNLAAEVPSQANGGISEDGLEWRIRLRDDVRWHDGEPFTAEDVKFTLELIKPDFRAWRTTGHSLVRDITVVSPTEITWRMEEAFAPYLSFLTETFIVPKHILEAEADPNEAAFNRAPVGTGAFKWGQRVAGDHLELVANPDYFGEGPYIERLIFKYIPDMTVLYTQFQSGDIDVAGRAYITPDNYEEAKQPAGPGGDLVPAGSVESIYLNLERPQFKDRAVREALYLAIDRRRSSTSCITACRSTTETFMPPQSFYYNPDLPGARVQPGARPPDPRRGGLGARPGRHPRQGRRAALLHNSTTTGAHLREQAQQFIQQTFAEIGVEMKIENLPAAVMWGDFWTQSQFDTAMVGITYLIAADPDVTNRFHTGAIVAQGGRGSNNAQYSNPEVDALLEEGTRTFDPEARRAIYTACRRSSARPALPAAVHQHPVYGRKAGIEGFVPNTNTRSESWHAAGWYWV
jgi:peptide/nickel transport system substrate-binding protein